MLTADKAVRYLGISVLTADNKQLFLLIGKPLNAIEVSHISQHFSTTNSVVFNF